MYISYLPPSPPPPTTLSMNWYQHRFIFSNNTDWGSMLNVQPFTAHQIRPGRGRKAHSQSRLLPRLSVSITCFCSVFVPLNPENPPDKTHTCYMSAGTSDKTEGLDWDKVHQRPQSTFRCWVLLDVDQSCWFTRQCYFYSRHITSPIMSLA